MAKPIKLQCACCANHTTGRQWWNRDNGYGLCTDCAKWLRDRGDLHIYDNYGTRGVHYDVRESV